MKIRSLLTGAMLGGLALSGVSIQHTALAAVPLTAVGAPSQNAVTHFSVYLPLTNTKELEQLLQDQTNEASARYHQWLTPAQFKQQFGPKASDLAKAKAMLEAGGFTILAERTQSIDVQGSVAAVEKFFATKIQNVKAPNGATKMAASNHGRLNLPSELEAMGAVIPAFSPHLAAQVHSQHMALPAATAAALKSGGSPNSAMERLGAADSFFYAVDMRESYVAPSFQAEVTPLFSRQKVQLAGIGSTIGIVISSTVLQSDINASFNSTVQTSATDVDVNNYSGNTSLPVPKPTIRPVLGGSGPFKAGTPDSDEASLDTQMSLGTAPGAKEIVYNMPDLTDASIIAAYTDVVEDNQVDVVSSSFGECELDYTAKANGGVDLTGILKAEHAIYQQGNAQGITWLASSGDNGAPLCTTFAFDNNPTNGTNFVLGVSTPADDPNVTGVGGTNLQVSPTPTPNDATYLSENANFDPRVPAVFDVPGGTVTVGNNTWGSGGGFSKIFAKPAYQFLVNTGSNKERSVPDVSLMMGGCPGDADLTKLNCLDVPRSAAIVWIGGAPNLLIGTSSSSPQFAGVVALAVEAAGTRLGNVNPLIYSLSALQTLLGGAHAPKDFQFFHRNISGNNNGYTVKPGQAYSEVLGNGTLDIRNFLLLPNVTPSGAPSTPSNP